VFNGDFLNSGSGWADKSTGTGTAGWSSSIRALQLVGTDASNQGAAEQPVEGIWTGNFTLRFDVSADAGGSITYKVGTSSGATDVATGTASPGVNAEVEFQLSNGEDTIYIGFATASAADTFYIDNVEIEATLSTFKTSDVDRYILLNGGVVKIQSIVSGTYNSTVEALVLKSLNTSEETFNYTVEDETWDATRGYPSSVAIFQDRLVLAGTTEQPTGLWLSEAGIFNGFGAGPDDEDSIQVELASGETKWLSPNRS